MIEVSFLMGDKSRLTVKGHGGCRTEQGGDIVCAACSIVTTMIAQTLEDHPDVFAVESSRLYSGDAELVWKTAGEKVKDASLMLEPLILGYRLLAQDYGKYLNLRIMQKKFQLKGFL